ncbi:MAG: ABC transporter ATP-binding protein, partial [Propionicimonas sp.]|nr:ABC transporter ATP-binding protein [Propionicimonas sp.]
MPTKPESVLDVTDLEIHFALHSSGLARLFGRQTATVKAVDGVNLQLRRGEVLGLVGESGSGKTTLGRAMLGLVPATSGSIRHQPADGGPGVDIASLRGAALRRHRTRLQMVFQDPNAALNPSMTIETAVGHPLVVHGRAKGAELRSRVAAALERVGLAPAEQFLGKYPSDLSGGQKQRAVIARSIILDPEVLIADEPVSMLDMSVRAKILQLMLDLKNDLGLTYVYITHDLATAKFFCDRIAIMYLGKVVEIGPTEEIFANPRHPYTQALLRAIPDIDPDTPFARDLPRGEIPDAARPPAGCAFHPRCPLARAECGWEPRDLRAVMEEHWTHVDIETYHREQAVVGDLAGLAHSGRTAVVTPAAGTAAEVGEVLARIRNETSADPLWRGVTRMETTAAGVEIDFADPAEISLRRVGGVEVACVLHR